MYYPVGKRLRTRTNRHSVWEVVDVTPEGLHIKHITPDGFGAKIFYNFKQISTYFIPVVSRNLPDWF